MRRKEARLLCTVQLIHGTPCPGQIFNLTLPWSIEISISHDGQRRRHLSISKLATLAPAMVMVLLGPDDLESLIEAAARELFYKGKCDHGRLLLGISIPLKYKHRPCCASQAAPHGLPGAYVPSPHPQPLLLPSPPSSSYPGLFCKFLCIPNSPSQGHCTDVPSSWNIALSLSPPLGFNSSHNSSRFLREVSPDLLD